MARRLALLFPGQASQQIGMGRLAYARFAEARDVFDRIDSALGISISAVCFEGPAERLQETRWQQPAVFACSMALYSAWHAASPGTTAVGAAGHSLGEYGALVAAGAIALEDAARLVALRGSLMQDASDSIRGGMSAVLGLDRESVALICADASRPEAGPAEVVVLANDNGPDQQVISGGLAALERAAQAAKSRGARRVLPLKVAGAFHSPLMQPAVVPFAAALARTPIAACAFPVIANCSAAPLVEAEHVRAELLRQVTAPVRWAESMHALAELSPEGWVDCGPGAIVAGLLARIMPEAEVVRVAALLDVASPA
jgi:[acyl-carrier-protein] S-malonyltransferase